MITEVIRPSRIRTTPTEIANALGARVREYNRRKREIFSWNQGLFLVYPPTAWIEDAPAYYHVLRRFFSVNKCQQRLELEKLQIPVPQTFATRDDASKAAEPGAKWAVRPLRTMGGQNYRLTRNPKDFEEGTEYIARLFPKVQEYRIITVFGDPVITIDKTPQPGTNMEGPINLSTAAFRSIPQSDCPLDKLDFYARFTSCPIVHNADVIAADVMLAEDGRYAVAEFNICPGLRGQNLRTVVDHIQKVGGQGAAKRPV
jgi:hypothetical protein